MHAAEAKQREMSQAQALLDQSIKLESGVYQRRMSTDEKTEFRIWQDNLYGFIKGGVSVIPSTPNFVKLL